MYVCMYIPALVKTQQSLLEWWYLSRLPAHQKEGKKGKGKTKGKGKGKGKVGVRVRLRVR